MSEFIKSFSVKNRPQFEKYKKYISNNDWSDSPDINGNLDDTYFSDFYSEDPKKVTKAEISKRVKEVIAAQKEGIKYKTEEFKLQNDLMANILERLKYFVKKTEGEHHLKEFKKFVKYALDIIKQHTDRVDLYVDSVDISKIENQEVRGEEIKLIKECYAGVNKLQDTITGLNIKEDSTEALGVSFHENKPAPLSMLHILSELYPEIKRALDALKIDFVSPPKNEMHIYNEKAPRWNPDKHFWLQDRLTLQYYVDEFKKIREGIMIDGIFISPWMYYHMNVFVTYYPDIYTNPNSGKEESKDILGNPPLRDTDWLIIQDSYLSAKEKEKMLFIAATRRAAKTTILASHFDWCATIGKNQLVCAGGSAKDLGQIEKNFKITNLNKNPAFITYNVASDWSKKIELGIKTKSGKTIPLSTLNVINMDGGAASKSELLAGYTPDAFCIDEIMKAPFLTQLEAIKPALDSPYGKRCVGILSGTGGNEDLSKDAFDVLNFPETHDILPIDYEALERGIDKEDITWDEDKTNRNFGTFIPAQMSAKKGMIKKDSDLSVYLNRPDSEELRKIKIKVTDWKKCNEIIKEDREKKQGNKISYNKEIVYYPIKFSEIFLSGKSNPFPVAEAKAHKEHLLRTGLWDRRRELYRDSTGNICCEVSTKDLAPFPHKGGFVNAPFLIFEDIPTEKPKYGTYTAGFDDYATEDSSTSSVASIVVMKNRILGDPFSEKIVASLSFRPERHQEVYEKWLLLMEAYNLEGTCFGENFNYAIKDFLDRRHLADKYLAPSVEFSQTFNIPNNMKRRTGWNPSTSKKVLFELFVEYCNQTFEFDQEDGSVLTVKGVQRIDDIGILDEIIGWGENVNVDRLTSVFGSYAYLHFLNSSQRWRVKTMEQMKKPTTAKTTTTRTKSFYSAASQRSGFYRKR